MVWPFLKKKPIEDKKPIEERVKNEIIKLINESRKMSPQDRINIFSPLQTLLTSRILEDIDLKNIDDIINYLNKNDYFELPIIIRYLTNSLLDEVYNLNYKNIWNEAANSPDSMNTAKKLKMGGRQRHINRRKIITRRFKKHKKKSKKNIKRHKKSKKYKKRR